MGTDDMANIRRVITGVDAFRAELRAKGIHVGMGNPPRCVVDDKPWPCTKVGDGRLGPDGLPEGTPT